MTTIKSSQTKPSFSTDDFAKALEEFDYQFDKGKVVKGKVAEYASDGAYIDIGAKCPAFITLREATMMSGVTIAQALPMEEEKEFLITSGQDENGQVTVSIRQLAIRQSWDNLTEIYEAGGTVQLVVTGTNKGGVTGEIQGLKGFIPRSHLMEKDNLESLIGQSLPATFIEVNRDTNKLVLSQRQVMRTAAMNKLSAGQLIEGRITKIQPYGLFVDLQGATGLLHIKQISNARIESLETFFKIGQEIKVMIDSIDEVKNRISLSTKVLEEYPGEMLEKMDQVMANAETRAEKARNKLVVAAEQA